MQIESRSSNLHSAFPREDARGSRTHFYRVAAGRLAIWLERQISTEYSVLSTEYSVLVSGPARSRTWSATFAESHASGTTRGQSVSRPGFEPGPRPSEGPMHPLHHRDLFGVPSFEVQGSSWSLY